MIRYHVTLTKEEREELTAITSKGKNKAKKIRNAHILLNCDEGEYAEKITNEEIVKRYNVSARTIDRVKKCFVMEGFDIVLNGRPRKPRPKQKVDGDVEAHIIALACEEPPEEYNDWTLRLLADKMVELKYIDSISYETVRQVLKKTNLNLGSKKGSSYQRRKAQTLSII